ncbi:hypothetical protein AZE42_08612, partial [Rhizopogon vesiculosus]
MLNATANGHAVTSRFDDWSRLFMVGVLGGVARVLVASVMFQRR